jgi:hypothetical protein
VYTLPTIYVSYYEYYTLEPGYYWYDYYTVNTYDVRTSDYYYEN